MAVLQSRKADAGQVFRVPAPDIEAVIERFLRDRTRNLQGDLRAAIEALVTRITIQTDSIIVELAGTSNDSAGALGNGGDQPRQVVSLPWSKKPFRVAKGLAAESAPRASTQGDPRAKDALLAAIGKARGWLDTLMAGGSLADIASQEGCTKRYLRAMLQLAFVSPRLVQAVVDGAMPAGLTPTRLSQALPQLWLDQERRYLLGPA